jgi:hypothetical protein
LRRKVTSHDAHQGFGLLEKIVPPRARPTMLRVCGSNTNERSKMSRERKRKLPEIRKFRHLLLAQSMTKKVVTRPVVLARRIT